jgi:hypothetical protein
VGKPTHSALEYGPCVCRTCYWALFTPSGPALLPLYLMKDIGWNPIKDIKNFDEYFPKKIAILFELIHSENPKIYR